MRILILALFIIPSVLALNLGSLVRNDYVELGENQTARFEIILWSKDENYTIFLHEKSHPEGWLISIEPSIISSQDKPTAYVNVGDRYVKAYKVNVFVNPLNARPGEYDITLSASLYQPGEKINVIQEREFNLRVRIAGVLANATSSAINIEPRDKFSRLVNLERTENKKWIIASILIITGVIVFLIIKY